MHNNKIETVNFDIIGPGGAKSQDGIASIRGFKILRSMEFFKEIELAYRDKSESRSLNYTIWSDCGNSFRNSWFMGYSFKELKQTKIHGKLSLKFFHFVAFLIIKRIYCKIKLSSFFLA